ncbi:MAG TPA: translation initiation factor IF-2 [Candidatus Deferrimicrobium sp.]|nr:translation initiation factor IF-2 [Candidatus Deferrimicrobium sp.]
MTLIRIYDLAKEYRISSNALLTILRDLKFDPKSHMSVATPEMIAAVNQKFTQEKSDAKREMEQREHVKEAVERRAASIGGIKVDNTHSPVAGLMRRLEKKQKRKDRRKRKVRQAVDQSEVSRSFRSVMAHLSGTKEKKKYRHLSDSGAVGTEAAQNVVEVNEFASVAELARLMDHKPAEVVAKLFEMGMMATINQRLDMDTIEMVAAEFGFDVKPVVDVGETAKEEELKEHLALRAPVVTIMGHVDHGKTTLLDHVRKTNVAGGEAGAITQHIGAYEVIHGSGRITFLDTPGHEAFTAMRARGAQITDIVVLVVAADDGVRPQTVEAIDHARAAGVPIIVAINKIDKPNANVDQVRNQLTNYSLVSEEWGGNTIMVEVSAKSGVGVDRLLDMILLQGEMMDLRADPTIRAQGVVVDARLERRRGPVATVLIQKGTCHTGDSIVAGMYSGRVRSIIDDRERPRELVGPAMPAQITGLDGVPQAGDSFMVVLNDQEAREIVLKRSQIKREQDIRKIHGGVALDKVFDRIKEGQIKELRLIIKADVDGSVEALSDTLGRLATEEVKTNIIHRGVGGITESDVLLASVSQAVIIGFQITIDPRARDVAKQESVDVRLYDVIYEAEREVKQALEGMLAPTVTEQLVGVVEVRNLFRVSRVGTIAGSYVKQGRISRRDKVRLVRDGRIVYTGSLGSLKRFKDDVREVKEGFECGVGLENFDDIKVGDVIEAIQVVEEARTLG